MLVLRHSDLATYDGAASRALMSLTVDVGQSMGGRKRCNRQEIVRNVAELAISDLHFHDGSLLDFVYNRPERLLRMSILDFLQRGQPAVQVDLVFEQVSYLLCSDLEPWGPSSYIYSGSEGDRPPITRSTELEWDLPEKILHIVMQSGDDIFIGYKQATVVVRAE